MKGEPFSACIVGVSGFGRVHYDDLTREVEAGRMRAVGATVINQDEERERCERLRSLGCRLFTDHREMLGRLAGEIDLCFIPTGIHLHAPMCLDAMRAGSDCLVEKPAAATVQDVGRMKACERETGRFVAVGYQHMYSAVTARLKEIVLEGEIGPLRAIKCRALWPRARSYYDRNGWAGRLKVGDDWVLDSPFNNALAHYLNLMCFLAGRERERSAGIASVQAELYRANEIESADTACIRIETAEGATLLFCVTHACERQFGPEILVAGRAGSITITPAGARVSRADGSVEEMDFEGGVDLRDRIVAQVRSRLADRKSFVCDLGIAGTHTLCVNAAHESSTIRDVPAGSVRSILRDGSELTVIDRIDDILARAFAEEKLFSEMGVPWAGEGEVVETGSYAGFRGGAGG